MPGRRNRRSINKFAQRRIIPAKMPEDLLIEEWDAITDEIRRFKDYDEGGRTKALREEICAHYGYSKSEFYRRKKKVATAPRASLLSGIKQKRISLKRLPSAVETVIVAAREEYFKENPEGSMKGLFELTEKRVKEARLKVPSLATVRRRYEALSARERTRLQDGAKAAAQKHNLIRGRTPKRNFVLERVQIDHTLCDIYLVDPTRLHPSLRPWITVAIDEHSRVVLAYVLSFAYPSRATIAYLMARMVAPKDEWLAELGVPGSWPFHGKPQRIYTDNAMEFRSHALSHGCREWKIDEPEKRPKGAPQFGAIIERRLGAVMEETKMLDGKTARKIKRYSETRGIPGKEKATMTIEEYDRWLANYFIYYHNTPHETLGIPPAVAWDRSVYGFNDQPGCGEPEHIEDVNRLFLDFLEFDERSLSKEGIRWGNIHYCSDELQTHIDEHYRGKFRCRYNPFDISSIHVFDPDLDTYLTVPAIEAGFEGWTKWDYDAAREFLKTYDIAPREAELLAAKARMDEIKDCARGRTRAARRASVSADAKRYAKERAPKKKAQPSSAPSKAETPFVPIEFESEVFRVA